MKKSAIFLLTLLWMLLFSIHTASADNETTLRLCYSKNTCETINRVDCILTLCMKSIPAGNFSIKALTYHDRFKYLMINFEQFSDFDEHVYNLEVGKTLGIQFCDADNCNGSLVITATEAPVTPETEDSASEESKPVIYPEDEFGAYYLNDAGKKEYIWYHTYQICTRFMENADECEGYVR